MRAASLVTILLMAACGSVPGPAGTTDARADAGAGGDGAVAVDATPAVAVDATPIDGAPAMALVARGPMTFGLGVCSAPDVFFFDITSGPPGIALDWTVTVSAGSALPSSGTIILDNFGKGHETFSDCTPTRPQTQTIKVQLPSTPALSSTLSVSLE